VQTADDVPDISSIFSPMISFDLFISKLRQQFLHMSYLMYKMTSIMYNRLSAFFSSYYDDDDDKDDWCFMATFVHTVG